MTRYLLLSVLESSIDPDTVWSVPVPWKSPVVSKSSPPVE